MINKKWFVSSVLCAVLALGYVEGVWAKADAAVKPVTVQALTSDGVTVYGYQYFAKLKAKSPLVVLFHQAGSNAHGEYGDIIAWLNKAGIRVMAWDARAGGEHFGGHNQTLANLPTGTAKAYCDAYPDLQAALDYVKHNKLADKVIAWGSSYSAALVFQLAAKNKDALAGIASFSPATGGAMAKCRAHHWLDKVKTPILVMRPKSEMSRQSSIEQHQLLQQAGAAFNVIDHGVHGSSMLVDSRTKNDMTAARNIVLKWLKAL